MISLRINVLRKIKNGVYLGVRTCDIFLCFVSSCWGLVILFNSLLALLFSLFYVIREFDRFLHRG